MEATRAMVPIIGCICICAVIFGIYYLRNKENMALIERGLNPREGFKKFASVTYLKYGLLMVGAGIGLLIAYLLDDAMCPGADRPALYFSLMGIGGGLGLIRSHAVEKREMKDLMNKE